jgi:hypothetical protein
VSPIIDDLDAELHVLQVLQEPLAVAARFKDWRNLLDLVVAKNDAFLSRSLAACSAHSRRMSPYSLAAILLADVACWIGEMADGPQRNAAATC